MSASEVILVNEHDQASGAMEKMEAHRKGLLHRAFSVFVFNNQGDLLLQQRAVNKYHSGGLWTNTCCSHPAPGQKTEEAAAQRLHEEMGFTTPLRKIFEFTYRSSFENGLIEHEYDHVFAGYYNGPILPDPTEVKDYCFKSVDEIHASLQMHPNKYTTWFRIAFPRLMEWALANKVQKTSVQ